MSSRSPAARAAAKSGDIVPFKAKDVTKATDGYRDPVKVGVSQNYDNTLNRANIRIDESVYLNLGHANDAVLSPDQARAIAEALVAHADHADRVVAMMDALDGLEGKLL